MDVRRIPLPRADPAADGGRSAAGGACPACHDDSTSPPRAIAGAAAYRWRVRAAAERVPAKPGAAGGRTRTPDWRRVVGAETTQRSAAGHCHQSSEHGIDLAGPLPPHPAKINYAELS